MITYDNKQYWSESDNIIGSSYSPKQALEEALRINNENYTGICRDTLENRIRYEDKIAFFAEVVLLPTGEPYEKGYGINYLVR